MSERPTPNERIADALERLVTIAEQPRTAPHAETVPAIAALEDQVAALIAKVTVLEGRAFKSSWDLNA